jgi:hypothetical protein
MPLDASDYQRNADECLRLASEMNDSKHRKALLDMAEVWQRLAGEAAHRGPQLRERTSGEATADQAQG